MQRTARRFRIAATAVAVLVIATLGLDAWQLWSSERSERASLLRHAEHRSLQLAASAAGRVAAIVRSVDFVLLEIRDTYGVDTPVFHALLNRVVATFPEAPELLMQVSVASAEGELVYSTLGLNGKVKVADRNAFKVHLDGADRLHISDLVLGRISGMETIPFTRPILRDGRFQGVVAVSLVPRQIGAILSSFDTASDAELALLGRGDAVLALSADARHAALLGRKLPGIEPLAVGADVTYGALHRGVFGDGAEHVVSRQGVAGTDLTVVAALDWNATREPLAQRFRQAWKDTVALGAALLLLGAGVIALLLRMSRQQQAVAANEARFRSLTQLSSDWYWEQDDRFRFTLVAGDNVARTGISAGAHLGRARWDIPALNLSDSDWARHRALLEAHQPFHDFEIQRPDSASGPNWLSISGEPMFDERGEFTGYRGVGRDITDRKLAEQALRESQATLAGVIDTAMDAIITIDEQQRILSFNPAAERIFGHRATEILDRPVDILLPERLREPHRRHVERFGESGATQRGMGVPGEIIGLRRDGVEIPLEATIARVEAGAHLLFSVMMRDVTERRRSEQRERDQAAHLRKLSRRLREVEERERRAMARELHDRIGQNLSTLNLGLGMLGQQIAAGQVDDVDEQLAEMQQTLKTVIGHTRDLMSELRPPALEEYGLLAALQDLATDFGRKTRIAARVEGSPPGPRPPEAIAIAMYRIAQEALNNAAKHSGAAQVRLTLASSDRAIELTISDDGTGFDASRPEHDDPTWGLTTMHERAEEAGIEITIDSAPGRGTRVTLRAAYQA